MTHASMSLVKAKQKSYSHDLKQKPLIKKQYYWELKSIMKNFNFVHSPFIKKIYKKRTFPYNEKKIKKMYI